MGCLLLIAAWPATVLASAVLAALSDWMTLDARGRHMFIGVGTLVIVAIPFITMGVRMYRSARAQVKAEVARRCPACGYDLTGNRSGVCPECGRAVGTVDKAVQSPP